MNNFAKMIGEVVVFLSALAYISEYLQKNPTGQRIAQILEDLYRKIVSPNVGPVPIAVKERLFYVLSCVFFLLHIIWAALFSLGSLICSLLSVSVFTSDLLFYETVIITVGVLVTSYNVRCFIAFLRVGRHPVVRLG